MEWSVDDVFKVINLYQRSPCLWDYQNPYYKSIDRKKNAWEEIAKTMKKSEVAVKKKIKNLRTAYAAEKKKVNSNKSSGSAPEDHYTPHLFYYNEMSFLEQSTNPREPKRSLSISNEDTEFVEFKPTMDAIDEQPLDDSSVCSESGSSISKKRNLSRSAKKDEKISCVLDAIIAQTSKEKETMFSTFGKSVGMQLEKMTLSSAMEAMAAIQKIMTEIMLRKDLQTLFILKETNLNPRVKRKISANISHSHATHMK